MSTISIRLVTLFDFKQIAELRAGSLKVDAQTLYQKFQTEIAANFTSERWCMMIAEANGLAVGYGRCQFYDVIQDSNLYGTTNPLPSGWYLRGIVVAKNFQRRGIASSITRARLEWLRNRGQQVYCFLDSDEKISIPIYVSQGFKEVSRNWKFKDPQRKDTGILLSRR